MWSSSLIQQRGSITGGGCSSYCFHNLFSLLEARSEPLAPPGRSVFKISDTKSALGFRVTMRETDGRHHIPLHCDQHFVTLFRKVLDGNPEGKNPARLWFRYEARTLKPPFFFHSWSNESVEMSDLSGLICLWNKTLTRHKQTLRWITHEGNLLRGSDVWYWVQIRDANWTEEV